MKKTAKVSLGGLVCALAVILMFMTGPFPFATFALPAMAGILLIAIVEEFGYKWALVVYIAISLLVLMLTPDREAAVLFVSFFGYYPTVKGLLERLRVKPLIYVLKFLVFNAGIVIGYFLIIHLFGLNEFIEEFGELGKYGLYIFWALGNVVFFIYDVAVSRLVETYEKVFRPRFIRAFK